MAKRVRLAKVESLERQQAELAARMKAARQATRQRKKEDDARRAAVLGAAVIADTPAEKFGDMIRALVPRYVKAKADLVLFKQWLSAEQIAAGEGDENRPPDGTATEAG